MFDVILKPPRIGNQNQPATPDYAGQDFETQIPGPVVPFTYDVQSGQVTLGLDFITPSTYSLNDFASQDFESLPLGVITGIPLFPTATTSPPVNLLAGVITPQIVQYSYDDFEGYIPGPITLTNDMTEGGGDVTLKVGFIKPYP